MLKSLCRAIAAWGLALCLLTGAAIHAQGFPPDPTRGGAGGRVIRVTTLAADDSRHR